MTTSDPIIAARIRANAAEVREKIAAAAARAGRRAEEIKLIGVTKYVEPEIARMLFEAGVADLGESRPQELWRKAEALADLNVNWHVIGHLQRNKVKRTLECSPLVHSVDSLRLLEEINRESAGKGKTVDALLEVNISGDAAKHGVLPGDMESLFPAISKLDHVQILGLMAMSGLESGLDQTRREFAGLRELAERLKPQCSGNVCMEELSMGMSEDFEIAIEEGATMVRVGSALLEGVKP
ncbi:MAG TPA: YggS family pyridoxal phosphate-dependent enzyme [Pirellulaceae bacterium]|jgi:hypothetical protein